MNTIVEFISQPRDHAFVDSWYELTAQSHFWFQWRMVAALQQLKSMNVPLHQPMRALEVGCGTGVLMTQFESHTSWVIDGTDLVYGALCKVPTGRGRVLYYDITEEIDQFRCAYDVVILFDVLEHIEKTGPFLESVLEHLKPNGLLLVNVPALPSLYGRYDEAAGHVRRYNKLSLSEEFVNIGLEIQDMRYWGFSLVPVLLMRKLVQRLMGNQSSDQIIQTGFGASHDLINRMFCILKGIETSVLRVPPIGSSLLMIGRKIA